MRPDLRREVSANDREEPLVTGVNGTLMARRTVTGLHRSPCPAPPPSSSIAATPRAVAAVSRLAKRPHSGLALTWQTRPRQSSSEEGGGCPFISVPGRLTGSGMTSCPGALVSLACSCTRPTVATMSVERAEMVQQAPVAGREPAQAAGKAKVAREQQDVL